MYLHLLFVCWLYVHLNINKSWLLWMRSWNKLEMQFCKISKLKETWTIRNKQFIWNLKSKESKYFDTCNVVTKNKVFTEILLKQVLCVKRFNYFKNTLWFFLNYVSQIDIGFASLCDFYSRNYWSSMIDAAFC